MKKISLILVLAILLGAGAFAAMSTPAQAQAYTYPPPPPQPYATPWVGSNTPWTYYNGDWFLNGILYYFFGPYGWAPYYAYPPTYIVRPPDWYGPRWLTWYRGHPQHWRSFLRTYPYWRSHHEGERYSRRFYEEHHRGQGGGWQQGFHGRTIEKPHPGGFRPAPGRAAPPETHKPGPARVSPPPESHRPAPARVAPEGQRPGPARVAPSEGHKPAPAHLAPPEGRKPAPGRAAPQEGRKPAPGRAAPQEERKGGAPGHKPEAGGHGEEKH
jgi:hypothetical protein